MDKYFALISEVLDLAPTLVSAGIDIAGLVGKARDALDANKAPDDVDWQDLDARVNDLRARLARDPGQ